jgi:transposase
MRHPKAKEDVRHIFQEKIRTYKAEGKPIVYIDESGFAHDMPRTHGYAPSGKRCYGSHDWHAKGRTNVIGALLGTILLTTGLFNTNINANIFHQWVIRDLLPVLPQGAVVVMDNATFHKRKDIHYTLQNAGYILEYLPPYSPDLNPIEQQWAKSKALRRSQQCSISELFENTHFM